LTPRPGDWRRAAGTLGLDGAQVGAGLGQVARFKEGHHEGDEPL